MHEGTKRREMRLFIYTILLAFVYAVLAGAFLGLLMNLFPIVIDFSRYGLPILVCLLILLLFPSYFVARRTEKKVKAAKK